MVGALLLVDMAHIVGLVAGGAHPSPVPHAEVVAAAANDWLGDEFSRGTWAIHRPGWYTTHHAEARRPEGRIAFAGSDIANGWSGFIDGAIESGLRAGPEREARRAGRLSRLAVADGQREARAH